MAFAARGNHPVVIVGAGLAGSLLALALARRGLSPTLVGPALVGPASGGSAPGGPGPMGPSSGAGPGASGSGEPDPLASGRPGGPMAATALSYGSLLGRAAARSWQQLERQHGPLGWRPAPLLLHGWPAPWGQLPVPMQALATAALAFSRVDTVALAAALPAALAAAGVERRHDTVEQITPAADGWRLTLACGGELLAPQLVLAAGAASRSLWPALPERLRFSWAGVVVADADPTPASPGNAPTAARGTPPWLRHARRGGIVQPLGWRRPALEARSTQLEHQEWIVDAGLAPWGERLLLGQISLVGPELSHRLPPDPAAMEQRLREGLGSLDSRLADWGGTYHQVAVPFCSDGQPLVGAADQSGLWMFTGFSGAFSTVPALAERLAAELQAALGKA
jgi:glycine/D-amino acid oxidase-like deaminating enzyme